jgi:mannose-6-phosphate isomerase-like protein (cupin superfamily)
VTTSAIDSAAVPAIVPPGAGRALRAYGNEIVFKLGAAHTAGALTLGLATSPPSPSGPPPHVHEREDELFIIVEGQYRVFVEGEWSDVGPGSVVYLPRGVLHTFHVTGERPGRHWVLTTSADFERFYAHAAEAFALPGGPDPAILGAIARAHGMRIGR